MKNFKAITISLFLVFTPMVYSIGGRSDVTIRQSLNLINYDIEQGLSHNSVFAIEQDYQGFIWFGTQEGLNRFDGYEFRKYYTINGDSLSIPNNIINYILEDNKQRLWIATSAGLALYNREGDNFNRFSDIAGQQLSNTIVTSLLQDQNGNFWIGTFNGGINVYSEKDQTLKIYNNSSTFNYLSNNTIRTFFEDSGGTIWIGTRDGLNRYHPEEDKFEQFFFHSDEVTGGNDIRNICEGEDGILWLATNGGGIIKFDRKSNEFVIDDGNSKEKGKLTNNAIRKIMKDRNGTYWIGSLNGLFLKNPGSNYLHHYKHNPHQTGSLSAHSIRDIFEDRDGNIWLALYYGGIGFFNENNSRFKNYMEQGTAMYGLSSNIVSAVVEDKNGNLYIGTEGGGLNFFDKKEERFHHFMNKPDEKGVSSNFVKSLAIDEHGMLWIGTIETGLDRYDPANGQFTNYQYDPDNSQTISDNYIRSILPDRKGRLWIGTNGAGLNLFNRITGKVTRIDTLQNEQRIRGKNINALAELEGGKLAIGTNKGLNIYDPGNKTNTFFARYTTSKDGYLTEIWCFYADQNNGLWIGTNEMGFFHFDLKTETFQHYSKENFLPGNVVYGILPDEQGHLWISTNKAITRFNPLDSTVRHYDSHSGLLSNQFNYNSYYKTKSGELIFGGNKGFSVFDPSGIVTNTIPAPPMITNFRLLATPVDLNDPQSPLKKNIIVADEATLNYKQTIFTIEFAALSYVAPEKNQYMYTLDGFLDDWVMIGNNRNVTFTNLDPGKYTFRLKVSNNDGLWNEEEASLKINVLPPWWKTNWAYGAYTIIILTIIYLLIRVYQTRIDEKNKLKYERLEKQRIIELNQMKLKFFTNISHEFKTPLSLIIGPLEELRDRFRQNTIEKGIGDKLALVHQNSLMLNNLIEQLMTFRKIESGALQLKVKKVEIVPFLRQIIDSFLELAKKKNIAVNISHELSPDFLWFDPQMLEKVFYNVLSNAMKHTPDNGRIEILVKKDVEKKLTEIQITNSGKGIPEDKLQKVFERFYQIEGGASEIEQGTGIGLSFAKDIVELHNGTIIAFNTKGKGATFLIQLLSGNDHLMNHIIVDESVETPELATILPVQDEINYKTGDLNNAIEPDRSTPLLLVVEDNESLNEYLVSALSDQYRMISASNGLKGLALTHKYSPDLIILDVMMPEMGGVEMTDKIKSDFDTCHIPVIMLTAKSSLDDQIGGISHGADAYMAKPFSMKLLRAQIQSLLQSRDNLKKVFSANLKLEPSRIKIQSMDDRFIKKAIKIVEENIADEKFNVNELGKEIGMSRMQLNRKLKGLLNQTPGDFIRTIRLKRATQLLVDGKLNVSEVIYHVGFGSRTAFTKAFQQQFGASPAEYVKKLKSETKA
jgi:ligand-binding sensor domain-containing protein/signal transduction histidine kinase/DNA-binding response OmpR family regulator